MIAIGGDVRFAAAQILDADADAHGRDDRARGLPRVLRRDRAAATRSASSSASGCRPSKRRRWCRRCWSTARCWRRRRRAAWSCRTPRSGPGCCSTSPSRKDRRPRADSSEQVLASAEALGHEVRFDRDHGRHVAHLATRLFDELASRARARRARAAAAAGGGAAARHRRLRQPARAPQALAVHPRRVADFRSVGRGDGDRRQHRALPPAGPAAAEPSAVRRARSRRSARRQQAGGDPPHRQRARRRAHRRRSPTCGSSATRTALGARAWTATAT